MCKNAMIVGIKPEKQSEAYTFMRAMAPRMSARDDDGMGYAAMTDSGMFGERWLITQDAFKNREGGPGVYNTFSDLEEDKEEEPMFAVLLHARMATCEVSMRNTHPFVREGVALIHNGVISNPKELKQITSTCDSECILNSYVDNGVAKDPNAISLVAKELAGYYTCGVLTRDNEGTPIMDMFRSSPLLYACYINELDALVFCTSSEMVYASCQELGWTVGNFFQLNDENMMRVNAKTGEFISSHRFSARQYSYAARSSGYDYYENAYEYAADRGYGYGYGNSTPAVKKEAAASEKKSLALICPPSSSQESMTKKMTAFGGIAGSQQRRWPQW